MPKAKTKYTIVNEKGKESSIDLDGYVASILEKDLKGVDALRAWLQAAYNHVAKNKPHLSRNAKGRDVIQQARAKALNSPSAKEILDDL